MSGGIDGLLTHHLKVRTMTESATDRYNNAVRTLATETEVRGRVDTVAADEVIDDREQSTLRFVVFLPSGTAITAVDEIEWLDEAGGDRPFILKVDGEPMRTDDAIGSHHLELFAYRIRG